MATSSRKPKTGSPATDWHLICVTRQGKVSMLQNLTLTVARETYQRLLPHTHPVKHVPPKCRQGDKITIIGDLEFDDWSPSCKSDPDRHERCFVTYGRSDREDGLERVDVVGPKGRELNPWAGVEPREIHHHCWCDLPADSPPAPPRPRWDRKRTDFWNHPRLWDRVKDPHRQMCWETVR